MIDALKDLIEGGFFGQAVIGTLVWGGIVVLVIMKTPVDDRLYDAGYVVLGYFFHVAVAAMNTHNIGRAHRATDDCVEQAVDAPE